MELNPLNDLTTKGTFLWSLDEIGSAVYEEMFMDGRSPNEKGSQKLTMSLCERWATKSLVEIVFIKMDTKMVFW
jgi:hypothetical protein